MQRQTQTKIQSQAKKGRQHRIRQHRLANLPVEILFSICLLLDFKTIFKMQFTSKVVAEKIDKILTNMDFWNRKTVLGLNEEQISAIKKSTSKYATFLSISSDVFEKNLYTPSCTYYKKCSFISFFKSKHSYENLFVKFDLEDMQPLILNDKASTLFRNVSRLGDIIPVVHEDNFDLDGVMKIITCFDDEVGTFAIGDVCFVGFLPGIINFKARQCFDLFIQAYLALHALFPKIEGVSGYSFNDITNIICSSKQNDFINRFIYLTIKLYPADKMHLYQLIEYACKNGLKQVVYDSFGSISQERKSALIFQWQKLDLYSYLLRELYPKEECRYNMRQALDKAMKFIENDPDLTVSDVIKFHQIVNASFDSSIYVLQGLADEHETVNSNVPKKSIM